MLLDRVHRFLDHLQTRRFQTHVLFRRELGSKPRQRKVYIVIHHNAFQRPDQLQSRLSRINCIIIIEAELVAAAFTMKEAVFCSNMMLELGFKEGNGSVPL